MRTPRFWSLDGAWFPTLLLAPLGWIYGFITIRRMGLPGFRPSIPVVSVGNFTAGGSGKTPTVLAIADHLAREGERPFILTRGYGGSEAGPLHVLVEKHDFLAVGDEALMMASRHPVIVSRDRQKGAERAVRAGATCLILDDALQNPQLIKDVSIAVVDGGFGFGNGFVMPAGPLRAPLARAARYVSDVLIVSEDLAGAAAALPAHIPVHKAEITLDAASGAALKGQRVVAFCGIGRPGKFYQSLREAGAEIAAMRDFPDHHAYSAADVQALLALARTENAALATTEKDGVRLYRYQEALSQSITVHVLKMRVTLAGSLHQRIAEGLAKARSAMGS